MKKVLILNSSIGVIQVVVSAVLYLITIPLFLKYLNNEVFGVYALITTIGNIGLFVNFGFNLSLIKFIGEQGIGIESDRDIVLSFLSACVFIVILSVSAIIFNTQILVHLLSIPQKFINNSTLFFFNFTLLTTALLFIGQVLTAVIDSQQKIYLSNILQIGNVLGYRIGSIIVLLSGGKLYEIGLVIFVVTIIWFIALLLLVFRVWKFTSYYGLFLNFPSRLKKHFSFGSKVYLTSISGFFYEPFVKILIGKYIGIVEVGVFDISFRIKSLVWSLIEKLIYPLMPLIASTKNETNKADIVDWVSRKMLLVVIPIIGIIYFLLPPLIDIWLTSKSEQIVITSQILLGGHLFTSVGLPMYVYLLMWGHLDKTFYIQTLNALLSALFFFIIVPYFGYHGAVWSFMGAVLCTHFLLLYFQAKYLNSNIFSPFLSIIKSLITSIIIIAANLVIHAVVTNTFYLIVVYIFTDLLLLLLCSKIFKLFTLSDLHKLLGVAFIDKFKIMLASKVFYLFGS